MLILVTNIHTAFDITRAFIPLIENYEFKFLYCMRNVNYCDVSRV